MEARPMSARERPAPGPGFSKTTATKGSQETPEKPCVEAPFCRHTRIFTEKVRAHAVEFV